MIDVFVRVYVEDELRWAFACAAIIRLRMQPDANVIVIRADTTFVDQPMPDADEQIPASSFHIESKRKAEELAQSDIYCVIDDDCLILGKNWLQKGCETLANNPEYGLLSSWSIMDLGIPHSKVLSEIVEMHSIGTPYFVRKGTLKEFPEGPKEQYDGILSKVVTDQGLKTGLLRDVRHNHMGHGYSKVIPAHWSA